GQNNATTLISRKELLKHKDIKVRKWKAKPLVFYTLNGSAITVSSWQSDQKMQLNERTTEPITVAEIDQLFSSTAGEKDFRPFLCTQPGCSKAFTTFDQLQTHETNMHGTKKLVCGIDGCHKSFVTPGQLTKHPQYARYTSNQPYPSNNLNVPYPQQSTPSNQYNNNQYASMPSPYSSSPSPGYHSPNMKYTHAPLKKYTLQPPSRKLPLSKTMPSLGFPGMFPQRPGQDEDVLTESNVRHGFIDRPVVSNEHTCAHDIVYGKLQDDQRLLGELGSFMVDVLQRQSRAGMMTGPSSFKPPVRTALSDTKREQWMQELAGGVVPLRKLARNVPHGFKGEKLLEALASKQVPFLRATWYIKTVGLSEMSQRSASNATASLGSQPIQWTAIVTTHLKKQLSELLPNHTNNAPSPHPSTPGRGYRAGYVHHDTPRPWGTQETRHKFEQKWSYSIKLARWQYFEGLLDQRTFLKWTLDTLAASSSFEIMWLVLTGIVQDYVDEYKRNRTLTKLLIETLIKSYSACMKSHTLYDGLKKDIEHVMQALFLSAPDMFVIPKLYHQYRSLFDNILGDTPTRPSDVSRVLKEYWHMIKARNEVFCGTIEENDTKLQKKTIEVATSSLGSKEERVVHVLDSIGTHVDSLTGLLLDHDTWVDIRGHSAKTAAKSIFGTTRLQSTTFFELVDIMCCWATSDSRYGDWKAYLVGSILLSWLQQTKYSQNAMLQDGLIRFLDNRDYHTSIVYLFDVLIRLKLFSYQKYLLRLIARGDLEPKRRHIHQTQQCLQYLASFPLLHPAPAYLANQRRVALYGTKNDGTEQQTLETLKHWARLAVMGYDHQDTDGLFGADAQDMTQPESLDTQQSYELAFRDIQPEFIETIQSTSRYSVLDFTGHWLLDQVKRFIVKSIQIGEDNWRVMTSPGSCLLNPRQFVTIVRIMEYAKDYLNLIEMALWVLEKSNDHTMYPYVVDCLRKYANYWKLTNNGTRIANAVWAKHAILASRNNKERCIMMYMVQLVQEGYVIDDLLKTQLQQDLRAKYKIRHGPLSIKQELAQLAKDPTCQQLVFESLCMPSQNPAGWISAILETVGDILAQERNTHVLHFHRMMRVFVKMIKDVADITLLTGQADDAVIQWLCHHPIAVQDMQQKGAWVPLLVTILVSYNVVGLAKVIQDYALLGFEQIRQQQQQQYQDTEDTKLVVFCQNLIVLIRLLVVQSSNTLEEGWQLRIEEYYRLQVQRRSELASSLDRIEPMFGLMERLVLIATNLPLSSSLLQDLVMLRADLLQITWFRQACLRDLNGVYQRFAAREAEAAMEKRMKKKMLNIVDELIGGNNLSNDRQSMLQDTSPDFVDKLHRVFLNVSQWNEAQCRVQVNLLLDNISLSDGHPNNPHILGDDAMDMPPSHADNTTNKDLQSFVYFFYDVVLSDIKTTDVQRRFQFFKNLIHELREPVLLELLHHGVQLLEGDPSQSFPDNVLLMQVTESGSPFDSDKFAYRSQSFLNITLHILAENVWSNEKKIALVKTVFGQISRFKNELPVYKVMQSANVCYADAVNALQLVKSNVDMAIALLVTEGLPENMNEEFVDDGKKLSLQDIRHSLLIRLRLV
ncbi:RNA polymerase II mediator complex subunit, partial [Rhizopus stolonifer]